MEPLLDPTSSGDSKVTVIPDLTKDVAFARKEFVMNYPFGRFYAGVPITTPQGFNIGAYCIVDDQARDGLTPSETGLLKEMVCSAG